MYLHLLFQCINFFIFVGILYYFLNRPLKEFWRSRAQEIKTKIDQAASRHEEASQQNQTLVARHRDIAAEMKNLKDQLTQNGVLEKETIISDAEKYATRLKEMTQQITAQEKQKAGEYLRSLTVNHSIHLAEKSLKEKMTEQDHQDYIARSLLDFSRQQITVDVGGSS